MNAEPIRYLMHPITLLAFAAAAQAFLDGATMRGVIAAVLGVLIGAATEAARRKVTPVRTLAEQMRDQRGTTLVEALVIIFLILIILIVLFRLL